MTTANHPIRAARPTQSGPRSQFKRWPVAGAAVLLFSGVAVAALPSGRAQPDAEQVQWQALGIAPLARGGDTGLTMSAAASVEPIAVAPRRQRVEMQLIAGGEPTGAMLMRAGATYAEAAQASAMIGAIPAGTKVRLVLGQTLAEGRTISEIELTPRIDLKLRIRRGGDGRLQLERQQIAVDQTPLRIRGRAGDGLYWALRAAGASPQAAAEYLRALGNEIDVGSEVGPSDAFDLVLASRASPTGERLTGPLLYAGIHRVGAPPIQLVRWSKSWVDAADLDRPAEQSTGLGWPVAGRITSTFGWRRHPILGYGRMHRGVDFGASSGTPIVAAASGQVTMAGWAGGYGRQVRISHGDGMASSYSHMSAIVAEPGSYVRQGQLIGYVGSSGLSTGAHLHYEVYQSGQAVDPLSVRFASAAPLPNGEAKLIKARLAALLKVGTRRS